MKLYEIASEYRAILETCYDHDTGEVDEKALSRLDEVKRDIKEKGIALASYIKNLEAERKAIEEAKKAMAEREARLDRRASYLSDYLLENMKACGITEISCPYFAIKLKKCPVSVAVLDEAAIPDEYKIAQVTTRVEKLRVKEKILAGVAIPGATLVQNLRLEIR